MFKTTRKKEITKTQKAITSFIGIIFLFNFTLFSINVQATDKIEKVANNSEEYNKNALSRFFKSKKLTNIANWSKNILPSKATAQKHTIYQKLSNVSENTKKRGAQKNIAYLNNEFNINLSKIKVISSTYHTLTAYNSDPRQTDDTPCITANNFNVCNHGIEDTVAANFLKFNTKIRIPELFGNRVFIVRDRMNRRYTSRVDIWMKDYSDARKFGRRVAKIEILE